MIVKYSEGCYRLQGRSIGDRDFDVIRSEAEKSKLRRARICCHYDQNDVIQEMFVGMMKDTYKGTYKYAKAASMLLLQGSLDYEFLSDGGEVLDKVHLTLLNPFIKIEAGVYHRPILLSDYVLMHETHLGPWGGAIERKPMPQPGFCG